MLQDIHKDFINVFHEKRLRTCPHRDFDHEFISRMTRRLLIATLPALWHRARLLANSSMTCWKGFIQSSIARWCTSPLCQEEGWHPVTLCGLPKPQQDTWKDWYPIPLVTNLVKSECTALLTGIENMRGFRM